MTKFLRWNEELAKEAYDLMLQGWTAQRIADHWTENGNPTTRNTIMGLVWRYRKRHGLQPVETQRPTKPKPRRKPKVAKVYKFAPPKPKVVRLAAPPAVEPLWVTLMDLMPTHCRFPVGVGKGVYSTYCGQPKTENSSYCPHHHHRCHNA
jgi:hypothetical protein